MLTRPTDLEDGTICDALAAHWGYEVSAVEYLALGFGSHHWRATADTGGSWFITIDDLYAKGHDADATADPAFDRLARVFASVRALHDHADLTFVVPPLGDRSGNLLVRLGDRYSMVVHPFLDGHNPGEFGGYDTAADRAAVLDLLVALHAATAVAAEHAEVDALALPHHRAIDAALAHVERTWDAGPYGERARTLLAAHEHSLRMLLVAYEELAAGIRGQRDRMVITHGEPHAGNVFVVDGRHRLIDWDTALIAVPERDLWVLDPGDGSIIEAYRRATGIEAQPEALELYRLWFDLDEIGGYLQSFREPHVDDANAAQMWTSLREDLQLETRWPTLLG